MSAHRSFGEAALVEAWYRGAWWLWLLRPAEVLFRLLAAVRRALYRSGALSSYRAPVPVVVVGNISVGGTGKTPVVIALVQALQARGIEVGVVSRGYGGSGDSSPHRVNEASAASRCGDEALLIYRRTGCPCVVAADRAAAVRALLEQARVDVIICDDGLQHYRLARDLEIALVDAGRGLGNGFCLPAGPLREPAGRLQKVDFVLYRGGDDPATAVSYEPDCLINVDNQAHSPASPDTLGRRVHAVAGIGQPQQFFDALAALGFEAQPHVFSDHHVYSAVDFRHLSAAAVIMTEKDAVKCAGVAGANAWSLRINARLPQRLVAAVQALVQH